MAVIDGLVRKLPDQDIRQLVLKRLAEGPDGKIVRVPKFSLRSLQDVKRSLREDREAQIILLRTEGYVDEQMQFVQDIKDEIGKMWDLYDQARAGIKGAATRIMVQKTLLMDISTLTLRLTQIYDAMPFIAAVQTRLKQEQQELDAKGKAIKSQVLEAKTADEQALAAEDLGLMPGLDPLGKARRKEDPPA